MLISHLLFACAGTPVTLDDSKVDDDAVDVRVTDDDIGSIGSDQFVLDGPEVEIPGASDVQMCIYGTYTGPTIGMHNIHSYQGEYGHHFTLNGTTTPALDVADGTVVDCSGVSAQYQMTDLTPLGLPNDATVAWQPIESKRLDLPDGMAVELQSGQRYIMQSHYLNTSTHPILVRDRIVVTTMTVDQVETWAAPIVFNRDDFQIPARGTLSTSFLCTVNEDVNLLYMLAHMHEWGSAFEVDQVDDSGATVPFFTVPTWQPVMRDAPPVLDMPDGPLAIASGTTFKTTCNWSNDTDNDLSFPDEMCDTVSIVYPLKTTIICDGDGQ